MAINVWTPTHLQIKVKFLLIISVLQIVRMLKEQSKHLILITLMQVKSLYHLFNFIFSRILQQILC